MSSGKGSRNRVGRAAAPAVLLALALVAAPAWGQSRGKVAGTVTDAATGESIPGANVVVVGTSLGAATDLDGDYYVANLQVGTYDVRATFIGYDTLTVIGVQVDPNATATVDFALQETTLEAEEVVVTSERPLVERDNTSSVTRVQAEEIAHRPTTELTQVLTTIPSIDVENGEITVRGRTLDEVAFLVDGARARNPLNHDAYTRVNLSAIQELEVITGAFNAEYGEAQSGVINVITKEGSDEYEMFLDTRYTPPGLRHFGTAFYDRSSPLFWENTHARHLEWWVENTDQWVDPNGVTGSDPGVSWTPEQAHENYLATHLPLTDYTETPGYQVELGLGGPVARGVTFYGTLKYRSEPPLFGNAYRDRGEYVDGNLKVAVPLGSGRKLTLSGFYGQEETGWGFYNDYFWAATYGTRARYAYYDFAGLSYDQTNGQSVHFAHALSASTLYEIRLARVQALREVSPFPDDPLGFEATGETTESPVASDDPDGDNRDPIGFNTTGYFFRFDDDNTEWAFEGDLSSQVNKHLAVKTGAELSYYVLDHFNQAKGEPDRFDDRTYRPYQGAAYAQGKVEYGGLIVNAGLRLDFYNANDTLYANVFDPFGEDAVRDQTRLYAQLSPRLGVSHPIDARTVLHFSYGHFFQRPAFNDYGEGIGFAGGSLNTLIDEDGSVVVLGNRNLRPQQTTAIEVGLERNFWDFFVLDLTGYYKDIRNTIRTVQVLTPEGGYFTNGNGDYADERGVELSLRKVPSTYSWGTISGYANFTTGLGILGLSGTPTTISNDPRFTPPSEPSGDFIQHSNPRLKLGLYYQTPTGWAGALGEVLGGISLALDYRANIPNEKLFEDFFIFEDQKYVRRWDQATDLRLRKEVALPRGLGRVSPYLEVQNLFNNQWIFSDAVRRASLEDQRRFVESEFEDLPEVDSDGARILDVGLYRNLPRSVVFGATFEF